MKRTKRSIITFSKYVLKMIQKYSFYVALKWIKITAEIVSKKRWTKEILKEYFLLAFHFSYVWNKSSRKSMYITKTIDSARII